MTENEYSAAGESIQCYQLVARQCDDLPPLAWVAEVCTASGLVSALHGKLVEVTPTAIFEGVWAGAFEKFGFDSAPHFFGTGVRIRRDHVTVVPSVALVDRVFSADSESGFLFSNSLPLLLAKAEVRLDPLHNYLEESYAILDGVERYTQEFRVKGNTDIRFRQHYYHPIEVRANTLTTLRRQPAAVFEESYSGYLDALKHELRRLAENARHSERRYPMELLSTVSAGYDSTATTALAAEVGVTAAYTSRRSNSTIMPWISRGAAVDDGTPIASALGVGVRDLRRTKAVEMDVELAAYSSSIAETELVFLKLAQDVRDGGRPAIVFTGYHGDKIWEAKESPKYDSPEILRGDTSGLNLAELRLVAGFVNVPVPFFFASDVAKIRRISNLEEMGAWSVGGDYNRPIPRRILEGKGVPRDAFGDRKRAVVRLATIPESQRLREEYNAFLQQNLGFGIFEARLRITWGKVRFFVVRVLEVFLGRVGVQLRVDHSPLKSFAGRLTLALFHWSANYRAEKLTSVVQQNFPVRVGKQP